MTRGTTAGTREPLALTKEVATYLQRAPHTLENWRWRRVGPRWLRLANGAVRYRWSDVDAWLDAQSSEVA